ncbi:MAG: hypothetical protein KDI39_15295 [Pseudomonadales bacterium]|nr:hypothetical protein [Pseudomonadales bacterium]
MIKPPPMKVKCVKCQATTIISSSSDAIAVPRCKKCGGEMVAVGSAFELVSMLLNKF